MFLTRLFPLVTLIVALSAEVSAGGLLDKLSKSAGEAASAVEKGAGKVGGAIESGANVVGETINSTADLATNETTPAETRAKLDRMAADTLTRFFRETPDAMDLYLASAGHAVFDTRKISILPVAAGFGRGVAVPKDGGAPTYMNMGTGGVGVSLGFGGFASQVVILFETRADFVDFVTNGYEASAEAGSVMGDDETNETVRFVNGRSTFVLSKKGWRVTANATGVKYWPAPDLN